MATSRKRHFAVAGYAPEEPEGDGPTLNGQPITNLLADAIEAQIEAGHQFTLPLVQLPTMDHPAYDF